MTEAYVTVSGAPVQVYNPAPTGVPHVVMFNTGTSVLYVGQAGVTPLNGLPLQPSQSISLPFAPTAIYAVAGGVTTGTPTTTTTAATAAGDTTLAVTSETGFVAGMNISIDTGAGSETATVLSVTTGVITLTRAIAYDHASGVNVAHVATAAGGSIHTVTGN